MKRKVSISTGFFQIKYGNIEALKIAKEIGLDAIDFSLSDYTSLNKDSIYAKSDDEFIAYFKSLKETADALGVEIGQTHGRMCVWRDDEEFNRAALEDARRDCLATQILGASVTVMHFVTTGAAGPNVTSEWMHNKNFEIYSKIIEFAKQYNVIVATETFGDAAKFNCCDFFGNINEFIKAYSRLTETEENKKHFKICVDTGHSNKAMRFNNPTPANVIRALGENVVALHLNDNDTFADQHKIPMTGTIDWKEVFAALDEIGYNGNYNMELRLAHFGSDMAKETGEFAVKVMKNMIYQQFGN